jgi:hypothetical protein
VAGFAGVFLWLWVAVLFCGLARADENIGFFVFHGI